MKVINNDLLSFQIFGEEVKENRTSLPINIEKYLKNDGI